MNPNLTPLQFSSVKHNVDVDLILLNLPGLRVRGERVTVIIPRFSSTTLITPTDTHILYIPMWVVIITVISDD